MSVYPQCPDDAIYLIEEKNKCIDDCIKDEYINIMENVLPNAQKELLMKIIFTKRKIQKYAH